jgi:CheY-like chemotaxis protein
MSRRPERRTNARSAQVLVVDDEPDIRELLELTLAKMGLDVDAVDSIAQAKERLKNARYDLCLTDMRLGDGEGLELVRHISAGGRDHRARQRRERGRGAEGRGVRLRLEAGGARAAARPRQVRAFAARARRRRAG